MSNIGSTAFAIDWNYVKSISSIKSIIGIRGQFTSIAVDKAYYEVPEGFTPKPGNLAPEDPTLYTFNNSMNTYFVQFSYRPAMVDNKCLKNMELLLRYNALTPPKDAAWGPKDSNGEGGTITRMDVGIDYWLSWRTGLRFTCESAAMPDGKKHNVFLVRLCTGL